MLTFKGFDANLTCRDFQYAIGETFKIGDGQVPVRCGNTGFHSCKFPFDVWNFYAPAQSRFCETIVGGTIAEDGADTKVASAEITIKAELNLPTFIKRGVDFILSGINWKDSKESNTGDQSAATNTGDQSAATNTGYQSAATNTGNQSAATNTGYQSAATNTGDQSAATNTGDQSAATNTGDQSAAEVSGPDSVAIATGFEGKAKANAGSAIMLVYRDLSTFAIKHVFAGIAGKKGIKPDTFYRLNSRGRPVQVKE